MLTIKSKRADTIVIIDQVSAVSPVLAGMAETLVELVVAVVAGEPGSAEALVVPGRVLTDAVVAQVGVVSALVHVLSADLAGPALFALALVALLHVLAGPIVLAGAGNAVVDLFSAAGSGEAQRTPALVGLDKIDADKVVRAGDAGAIVNVVLALQAPKA